MTVTAESHGREMMGIMGVNLESASTISRAVVREHGGGLTVVAVSSTEGGSDRAEVLITIGGCHSHPCRFLVNITRAGADEFEREFRQKLSDALQRHAARAGA